MKIRLYLLLIAALLCAAAAFAAEETVLFNPQGGMYYHTRRDCPSMRKDYWAVMEKITVSQLQQEPYHALKRCPVCYVESFGYEDHAQADLIREAQQLVMQQYDRSQARMNGYAAEVGQSSGAQRPYMYVKLTPKSWEHPEFFVTFYEDGSAQVGHFECSLLDKYIDEQVAEKQALFRNWTIEDQCSFAAWLRAVSEDYLDVLPPGTAHLLKHQYGLPSPGDITQETAVSMARSQVTESGTALDQVTCTSVSYYVDNPEEPVWHVRFYERAVLLGEAYIAARQAGEQPAFVYINPNLDFAPYFHCRIDCGAAEGLYDAARIEVPLTQIRTGNYRQFYSCPACYEKKDWLQPIDGDADWSRRNNQFAAARVQMEISQGKLYRQLSPQDLAALSALEAQLELNLLEEKYLTPEASDLSVEEVAGRARKAVAQAFGWQEDALTVFECSLMQYKDAETVYWYVSFVEGGYCLLTRSGEITDNMLHGRLTPEAQFARYGAAQTMALVIEQYGFDMRHRWPSALREQLNGYCAPASNTVSKQFAERSALMTVGLNKNADAYLVYSVYHDNDRWEVFIYEDIDTLYAQVYIDAFTGRVLEAYTAENSNG